MTKKIQEHINEFNKYYEYLVEENSKYNLTSIVERDEAFIKHFEDSIALGKYIDLTNINTICDVGSGAGFPSIPLKICYPHLKVTIVEPTMKRVNFMRNVISLLNLKDIEVIPGRAEDISKEKSEMFDIVCARAVANMSQLLELLIGFCKVNGLVVAYKGDKGREETSQSQNAIKTLHCEVKDIIEYNLSNLPTTGESAGTRTLVMFEKKKKTDKKYPRRYAEIKKNPL